MRIRIQVSISMRIRIWIQLLLKVMGIWPLVYRPYSQASILSLQASIVSVHGPPRLYFEPLKLLAYEFNADPDSASKNNADPEPDLQYQ
jgi:hypothetical protein